MKIQFLGADRQVTGSRHLVDTGSRKILVDCGLFQERCCQERNWAPSPVPPEDVDVVLLTHAHLDHAGLLPKFVAEGFAGPIMATPPSIDLARIVLEDSARIQVEDAAYKRRRHARERRRGPHPEVPLYTPEEAQAAIARLRMVHFDKPFDLGDGITACYRDAGHILGSSMIELTVPHDGGTRRIVFSGDIGQWNRALMPDPSLIEHADVVVMESTYGDRDHDRSNDVADTLQRVVHETVERGGNVVIPTFAIDRAQALLYFLSQLAHEDRIPDLTVFLDSPMAISATTVYKRYPHLLDDETRAMLEAGRHPFQFPGLHFVRSADESKSINSIRGSCIVLAGSGMCTGGRIKHHLRQNIGRPESTVLFTGYQAQDTLGRHIVDGDPQVRIHGRRYEVKARIERLDGLSAHAGRDELMRWLGGFASPPRQLFLTHGEADVMLQLAGHIRDELGWDAVMPEYEQIIEIA
ncbi:MAG: MBL fold metallo-hydrolase RNA specificity domain-containing protein [Planctomycetota bacterium]